jgi:hypothetical protein
MKTRTLLAHQFEVLPLLEGRQSVVIRPVVPQPYLAINGQHWIWDGTTCGSIWAIEVSPSLGDCSPFGESGDSLIVKETWAAYNTGRYDRPEMGVFYRADDGSPRFDRGRWRASTSMRPEQSRLALEVVSVRVVQLKDLTPEDVPALGIDHRQSTADYPIGCNIPNHRWYFGVPEPCGGGGTIRVYHEEMETAIKDAWDDLYAKKGYPYDGSIWAWVCAVRRVDK